VFPPMIFIAIELFTQIANNGALSLLTIFSYTSSKYNSFFTEKKKN
jgi:hypothetical protein